MSAYTSIIIIYNPNSTGDGKHLAQELRDALLEKDSNLPVKLVPTKHAGHAEELAYETAMATENPLIISSSGDGGYHEVVNGVIRASKKGARATAGLLPAGNANDHYQHMHGHSIVKSIIEQKTHHVDVLTFKSSSDNKPIKRYAHSYIGIGLTPNVGQELNKTDLNWFKEIFIVLKVLFFLRPVRISVGGKIQRYDSLIFSNIDTMSKFLKLSKRANASDGKFEVTAFRRRNKFRLISALIHSSTTGLKGEDQSSEYVFSTVKPILVQLDGEIIKVDERAEVKIGIEHKVLSCIV